VGPIPHFSRIKKIQNDVNKIPNDCNTCLCPIQVLIYTQCKSEREQRLTLEISSLIATKEKYLKLIIHIHEFSRNINAEFLNNKLFVKRVRL
jgi:hypothetical protein